MKKTYNVSLEVSVKVVVDVDEDDDGSEEAINAARDLIIDAVMSDYSSLVDAEEEDNESDWINNDMLTQKEIKMANDEKQEARELLIDSVVNCLKDDFSWQEYNPLREFILSKLGNRDLLEYMKSRARGTKS